MLGGLSPLAVAARSVSLLAEPAGPSYGPDFLAGTGDFASDLGWTVSEASITGNKLVGSGEEPKATRTSGSAIVAGTVHYEFDLDSTLGLNLIELQCGAGWNAVVGSDAADHFEGEFATTASNSLCGIRSADNAFTADNLIMKQVL